MECKKKSELKRVVDLDVGEAKLSESDCRWTTTL